MPGVARSHMDRLSLCEVVLCCAIRPGRDRSEAMKCLSLNLSAALLTDTEPIADLCVALGTCPIQAEAAHQYLAVSLR